MAKKRVKLKYTNLFISIIILYILVHIIIWTIGYFTKTLVLECQEIHLKIKSTGLVVMEEFVIKSDEKGIVNYNVSNGEKIQKDKIMLTISRLNQNEELSSQIKNLKNEIKKLEKDNNSIDSNIILNKKEQLKILKNKKDNYYSDYKSPISGIVSFKYDYNFEKIKLDEVDNINSKMINSIQNNFREINSKNHKVNTSDILLRIVNSNEVYICILSNRDVFEAEQEVEIEHDNQKINGKVYKVYKKNNKNIVIIKIMEQNTSIYDTRVKEFGIIYRKIEGFKIPIDSVVEKNNKLGVYVINEESKMPEFVSLGKNYYKDEKYFYVDYNRDKDEKNLNLYDRILLYPNIINKNIKVSR